MTHEEGDFRRYLLGELPERERDALEMTLMTSDEAFSELLIAEDELVDAYCAGALDEAQKRRFLSHFLITRERRHQVRFGAALRAYVSALGTNVLSVRPRLFVVRDFVGRLGRYRPAAVPAVWRLPAAAALVALLVGGLWMRGEMRIPEDGTNGSSVASVFLTAGRLRNLGEPAPRVALPFNAKVLELQLDLSSDQHESYEMVLERADGTEVLARRELSARTLEGIRVVVTEVPASRLAPGDYRVILRGKTGRELQLVERYEFRISSP